MYLPALFVSFAALLALILVLVAESYAHEARLSQAAYNARGRAAHRQTRTSRSVAVLTNVRGL